MHGYELHRVVAAHGELYADLKKANVYYLLDRLATDGYVLVRTEPGAPGGARGERLVYEITENRPATVQRPAAGTLLCTFTHRCTPG